MKVALEILLLSHRAQFLWPSFPTLLGRRGMGFLLGPNTPFLWEQLQCILVGWEQYPLYRLRELIDLEVLCDFTEQPVQQLCQCKWTLPTSSSCWGTVTHKNTFTKLCMEECIKCLVLTISLLNVSPTKPPAWSSASPSQQFITYHTLEDSQLLDFCLYYLLGPLKGSIF